MTTNGVSTTVTDSLSHWDVIHLTTSGKLTGETLKKYYDDWSPNYNQVDHLRVAQKKRNNYDH